MTIIQEINNSLSNFPKLGTEFGRKSFNFMAVRMYNELPLSARKLESRGLFKQFLDNHFKLFLIFYDHF